MILLNIFNVIEDILFGAFVIICVIIGVPVLCVIIRFAYKKGKEIVEVVQKNKKDNNIRSNMLYGKCYKELCDITDQILEEKIQKIKKVAIKLEEKASRGYWDYDLIRLCASPTIVRIDTHYISVGGKKINYSKYGVEFLYPQELEEFSEVLLTDLERYVKTRGCDGTRSYRRCTTIDYENEKYKYFDPIRKRFNNTNRF